MGRYINRVDHHPVDLVSPDCTHVILPLGSSSNPDQVDYWNVRMPYHSGIYRLQHRVGLSYGLDLLKIVYAAAGCGTLYDMAPQLGAFSPCCQGGAGITACRADMT